MVHSTWWSAAGDGECDVLRTGDENFIQLAEVDGARNLRNAVTVSCCANCQPEADAPLAQILSAAKDLQRAKDLFPEVAGKGFQRAE